jgi:hypothetical protein
VLFKFVFDVAVINVRHHGQPLFGAPATWKRGSTCPVSRIGLRINFKFGGGAVPGY